MLIGMFNNLNLCLFFGEKRATGKGETRDWQGRNARLANSAPLPRRRLYITCLLVQRHQPGDGPRGAPGGKVGGFAAHAAHHGQQNVLRALGYGDLPRGRGAGGGNRMFRQASRWVRRTRMLMRLTAR